MMYERISIVSPNLLLIGLFLASVLLSACAATLGAAIIGAISDSNIEQSRQQAELTKIAIASAVTQNMAAPASTELTIDIPVESTISTFTPYPTPIPPTFTVEPSMIPTIDTRPADTSPGTVLQIGETWTTQGFSVQLRSLTFAFGDEADLDFVLTNNTGHTLFFHFSNDTNVVMKDDLGRTYHCATPYEYDLIIENGSYENLRLYKGGNFSGIQYLTITVDLPNLIYAQWKN